AAAWGGAGGGVGAPPPVTPPGGIGGPGPGDGGGGGGGGGGGSTSGGSAVPPLDSGIVGPSTDVGADSNPKVSVDVSICSFEDKVKIHWVGQAYWGFGSGTHYYEDGRVLRVVDRLGKEFIETKITTSTREGFAQILVTEKGHFDVTLILDHLPVEIAHYPLAYSTLQFYMTDENYEPSGALDQMQSCPAEGNCFDAAWTVMERPYFDSKLIEAAKTFKGCGFSLKPRGPVQL